MIISAIEKRPHSGLMCAEYDDDDEVLRWLEKTNSIIVFVFLTFKVKYYGRMCILVQKKIGVLFNSCPLISLAAYNFINFTFPSIAKWLFFWTAPLIFFSQAHETVFFVIRKVRAIKTLIIVEMGKC